MKLLKNKAKKALMAAVTMSLVMGVCGSAMAAASTAYYGQNDGTWGTTAQATTGFTGEWTGDNVDGKIFGGYSKTGEVSYNTVTIITGNIMTVCAGLSDNAAAQYNVVNIKDGNFTGKGAIFAGKADKASANANNNTVNITGGSFAGAVYGAKAAGEANDNQVNLIGQSGQLKVITGYKDGKAVEEILTNKSTIAISNTVYGGNGKTGSKGNTLNVAGMNTTVKSIENFQNMNIFIGKDIAKDDVMLTVSSALNLTGVESINAGVETGSKLVAGDKVTLISATSIKNFNAVTTKGIVTESDFKQYGLEIAQEENQINAKITSLPGGGLTDNSKSPVETQAAGLTMLTTGADMLASQGFDNAATAIAKEVSESGSANTMTPFVAVGGAKSKVKSGSHVDVKGWNLNVGLAKEIENKAGKLLIGPVIEYGKGSYDSYLDNDYHGEGDTKYIGGGVMAKQTNKDGLYYEGSLRVGKLDNDYKARANSYDSDASYFAAHIGVGKIVKLSEKDTLDYYGKYFYTHQKDDDTTLHAGGVDYDLHFDSVESNRTRIGGRITHAFSENNSIYAGLAWQHEFSGTARATIDGTGTPAPSVKGDTGIMELGWKLNANKNLDLDLGATAYTGKKKGASLNLAMNFKF